MTLPDSEAALVRDCIHAAEALRCYCEWISQRGGKGSGTTRGAPDCLLYCNGYVVPIELKRAKSRDGSPGGKLSYDQIVAIERRRAQGVDTFVVDDVQMFATIVGACRRGTLPGP
jgi:hypothetical protein